MNINDIHVPGFEDWFSTHADIVLQSGQSIARVMTVDRNAFLVRDEVGEKSAELAGKYRLGVESEADLPCVGDWVCVEQASPTLAIIHAVLPRRTFLRRKRAGKTVGFQMIAANLDVAFIVQSCHYDFNIRRLDRYLVVANEGHIEPVLVLSKTDMISPEDLAGLVDRIKSNGISARILPISNVTGIGLQEFRDFLVPGKTHCLLGSSGVGKTTIINRLIGRDVYDTKAVSETGEGVHTTSRRQLIVLNNGAVLVDTPGMRELGLLGAKEGVGDSFSDIRDLASSCRFADCTHTQEPGCAVLMALETGELSDERYQSYLKLRKETEHHDMSYVDKRKKDKGFGSFIKSAKKNPRQRR